MGIEIILHEMNRRGVGIGGERLAKEGILTLGALGLHLPQPSSRERFDGCQEGTGTQFLIGILLFAGMPFLHGYWHQGLADQKAGPFIVTDHGFMRVGGTCVELQNVLHVGEKGTRDLRNAPGTLEMGFQIVFFNSIPTMLWEMDGHRPRSTALSANRRSVQRS